MISKILQLTSSKTTNGDFPPSSSETFFKFDFAAASMINFPTSVDPVNATLRMSWWEEIAPPAEGPNPVMTLTTP